MVQTLAVLGVVILAAVPRFFAPDLVPFGYDEALEALRARAIALGARPVANEVTSWLLPDPAGLLYFYALAEGFPQPAVARVIELGFLNTLSVLVTYGLGRAASGHWLGITASALYAVSPWAIYFGRQPWVNAQPVLTAILLLSAVMVVQFRDQRWVIPFCLALGLQMQTHLLGMIFGLPAAVCVLLWIKRFGLLILPGAILAALINVPFAVHAWQSREGIAHALVDTPITEFTSPVTSTPRLAAWFLSGWGLDHKLIEGAQAFSSLHVMQTGLLLLVAVLFMSGVILAIIQTLRRATGWESRAILLIFVLLPLTASMAQSRPVYIHYMLTLIPAGLVLIALPVVALWGGSIVARVGALMLISPVLIGQGLLVQTFFAGAELEASLPPTQQTFLERQTALNEIERRTRSLGIGDLFGLPLRYWQQIGTQTQEASHQRGITNVTASFSLSDSYALYVDRRRMALDYVLGTSINARFPLEGTSLLPITQPGLLLVVPGVDPGRAGRGGDRVFGIPLPGTREETRLQVTPPRPIREQPIPRKTIQARFANGVQLVSFDLPSRIAPGEDVLVTSAWTFDGYHGGADQPEVSVFFHLLNTSGTIVTQNDGLGLPSATWREGDLLVRRTTMHVPEDASETLTAVLGVYNESTLKRLDVQVNGLSDDDRVVLGTVTVRKGQ